MSGSAPRALSEWLRLMLAEIAAKRADAQRARSEASRRAAESAAAAPREPPREPPHEPPREPPPAASTARTRTG